jgi:hypothetical protein
MTTLLAGFGPSALVFHGFAPRTSRKQNGRMVEYEFIVHALAEKRCDLSATVLSRNNGQLFRGAMRGRDNVMCDYARVQALQFECFPAK